MTYWNGHRTLAQQKQKIYTFSFKSNQTVTVDSLKLDYETGDWCLVSLVMQSNEPSTPTDKCLTAIDVGRPARDLDTLPENGKKLLQQRSGTVDQGT